MIEVREVNKIFNAGKPNEFRALTDINSTIRKGKVTVLRGPSGSGKTTLLSILGCMSRPTSGRVWFEGREITSLPERFMTEIRRESFGFVFQQLNLIRGLSALDNVMLPVLPTGESYSSIHKRALELLERFRIGQKASEKIEWLSGGQAQRVAIVRAMMNNPKVIFADEPTAHMDTKLAEEFMEILGGLNKEGMTLVISSHDPIVCASGFIDHIVHILDGKAEE